MKPHKIIGVFAVVAIGLLFYLKFNNSMDSSNQISGAYETIFVIISLFLTIWYSNIINRRLHVKGRFSNAIIIYFIWLWFSSIIATNHHPFGSMNLIGLLILPLLTYSFFYKLTYLTGHKFRNILILCISVFVIYISVKFLLYRSSLIDLVYQTTDISGGAYFPLVFLPLVLLNHNKIFKYLLAFLIVVVSILSAKRGGVISVGAAVTLSLIFDCYNNKNKISTKKRLVYSLLFCLFLFLIFNYASIFLSDDTTKLLDRFEDGDYKHGSRNHIYLKVIDMIFSSNIYYLIFGHGWDSVLKDGHMGYSAHNDFLESFYDFGAIGFLLYLYLQFALLRETIKLVKMKSEMASSFIASWIMFLIFGLVSHIILYPPMSIAFSLYWGITQGIKHSNVNKTNNCI